MAFHEDYAHVLEGDTVAFRKGSGRFVEPLPQGQGFTVSFHAIEAKIELELSALDLYEPTRVRSVGSTQDLEEEPEEGPGSTTVRYNHVRMRIELFAPGRSQAVAVWDTERGWSEEETFTGEHNVGDPNSPRGAWQCRVTNRDTKSATVHLSVLCFFDREPLRSTTIRFPLLNHTYQLILDALTPKAVVDGGDLIIRLGDDLQEFFQHVGERPEALEPHRIPLELPSWIGASGKMQSLALEAASGRELLAAMRVRWQEKKDEYEARLTPATPVADRIWLERQLTDNDAWKRDWEQRVQADFPTLHASVAFSDIPLATSLLNIDIPLGTIQDAVLQLFWAFEPGLRRGFLLGLSPARVEGGIAEVLVDLGIKPEAHELIESAIRDKQEEIGRASRHAGRYLGEALGRLCARDCVFMQLSAPGDSTWLVRHTALPSARGPRGVPGTGVIWDDGGFLADPPAGDVAPRPGEPVQAGGLMRSVAGGGAPGPGASPWLGGGPPGPPAPGGMPDDFIVRTRQGESVAQTLDRLDRIGTLVVVMMENRSFDHMLGYLRNSRPEVEGLRGDESNLVTGYSRPFEMRRARGQVPDPFTKILYSPHHATDHVKAQIAGGEMSGFAQDFEKRYPGRGQLAMTYYVGDELWTYDFLSTEFCVCDHWFAAHPGGTWPNRWITLSGTTPDLFNRLDDPRLGFFEGITIFEVLSAYGIEWCYFESDLSMIRTFNRYRLDTSRVLPLRNTVDPSKDFATMAANGSLPPVVFVEPNFSDIPPLSSANDDLAPVDLGRGQNFIAEIYNTLVSSTQFSGMLFVVTYDEHGGFYDHVAPPGTPLGGSEWRGVNENGEPVSLVPPVYHPRPDEPPAPDHLGVRVPSFAISPWIRRGDVCKEVFDHTAIIKTILLRHRNSFPTHVFGQFGQRVKQAAHLGLALDPGLDAADEGRVDRPQSPPPPRRRRDAARVAGAEGAPTEVTDSDDFHESLRRVFLPKRG